MDCGLFGVRFLFLGIKKERCSIDELLIYFATPPPEICGRQDAKIAACVHTFVTVKPEG